MYFCSCMQFKTANNNQYALTGKIWTWTGSLSCLTAKCHIIPLLYCACGWLAEWTTVVQKTEQHRQTYSFQGKYWTSTTSQTLQKILKMTEPSEHLKMHHHGYTHRKALCHIGVNIISPQQ
jgi:hypothetical protein